MLIKIINGTYGYHEGKFVVPKTHIDPPFEEDDERAEKLIKNKIAVAVEGHQKESYTAKELDADDVDAVDDADFTTIDKPEYSIKMRADQLEEIMNRYGIEISNGMAKKEMIAKLDEFFSEVDENLTDEAPPNISVADPIV